MKTLKTNSNGYNYKYTDIAGIHEYLQGAGLSYYQYIETIEGNDYIMTVPIVEGKELPVRKGCRVVQGTLQGKSNPAQEQGSAITYARRYSLLLAFGLATEDDDAQSLSTPKGARTPLKQTGDTFESNRPTSQSSVSTGSGRPASERQIKLLTDKGIKFDPAISYDEAYQLISTSFK